jgi:putative ATP-dependent endonuclease of OLD family
VSDYVDRHFSWNKGSPLYSLYMQYSTPDEDDSAMIDALREAKKSIDATLFSRFDIVVNKVQSNAATFGASVAKTNNTIDFKDIVIKDGKLSMHDREIPFRLKGKGSRRLISMAIQLAIADAGGIILIDEVEQGLEPDRAQNLVSTLKSSHKGQVFITTHSRDVLVELNAANLFLMRNGASNLTAFDKTMQGVLRGNPEAFFARKVLVVEGATEEGVCRALNQHRRDKGWKIAALLGVRLANGKGSTGFAYCRGFAKAGFSVALFTDSDVENGEEEKIELRKLGIDVVDWPNGDCIELAMVKNLPFTLVMEFFNLAAKIRQDEDGNIELEAVKDSLWQSVEAKYGDGCPPLRDVTDTAEIRIAIGMAAKTGDWFKRIDRGQQLGKMIFSDFDSLKTDNIIRKQLDALSDWIDV